MAEAPAPVTGTADAPVAVRRLLARSAPSAGAARVLALDGRTGSGKTTLASAIASEHDAPVVELEYLYGGWDGLRDGIGRLVAEVLEPLSRTGRALVPVWDWHAERWAEPRPLRAEGVIVIEGVGAGALAAAPYLSALVWMDAPAAERRRRAMARDGELFKPHWDRWTTQEDDYLATDRAPARADLVIVEDRLSDDAHP